MTYELAKQLKDAGFPQKEDSMKYASLSGINDGSQVYYPDFLELIEACGKPFQLQLTARGEYVAACLRGVWEGSSYEEAVVDLYCAINNTDKK